MSQAASTKQPYDVIIVGAGTAGCVLAGRLSERPDRRVLLIEAGPPDKRPEIRIPAAFSKLFKTEYDWGFSTVPQAAMAGREMYWPRGKTLGGSSSINAQMHVRGNRRDFDDWVAAGNPDWNWDAVLPFFRRSEQSSRGPAAWRGTEGPMVVSELRDPNPATHAFIRAAGETGIDRCDDVNGERQDGVDYTQVTQRNGRRWSAADAYLRPALRRPNLTVVTRAHAKRIRFHGTRATGVEFMSGSTLTVAEGREVIVACGAVGSPHLLELSGVGDGHRLQDLGIPLVHDLPEVGENLQDHLAAGIVVRAKQPTTLVAAERIASVLRYLLMRRGMLTSNVAEACAFVRSDPDVPAPDLELLFAPAPFVDHGLTRQTEHGLTIGVVLLTPKSAGSIHARSRHSADAPAIDPRYLTDAGGDDLRRLLIGLRLCQRVLAAPGLSAFAGEQILPEPSAKSDDALGQFIRERAETLYHPVGTCRMGRVVDQELRVKGVEGLRVVDASVMPAIVRGHTNAATVMIAERACDFVNSGGR